MSDQQSRDDEQDFDDPNNCQSCGGTGLDGGFGIHPCQECCGQGLSEEGKDAQDRADLS